MKIRIEQAELNLQRKLDWISRYDSRIAFVSGIAIAMLGVLVNAITSFCNQPMYIYLSFGLALGLLFTSLIFVYKSQYPKTKSSNASLIYFGTIANLKVSDFKKRFKDLTDEEYLDDLLSQTHINAQILSKKFSYLKISLILILLSVIPWLITIYFSKLY
ncbi:MAG: hypothetical protein KBB86_00605 [Candidatus Pacebacteria bacterium]|nr:hypothetical protein [Candidatus Paceibacterota bacterium]